MLSVNELQGTLLKAGRGAGLPLGLSEDLSMAAPDIAIGDTNDIIVQIVHCLAMPFDPATADLSGQGVVMGPGNLLLTLPSALDLVTTDNGPVVVNDAPQALANALIAGRERVEGKALWADWIGPSKLILHGWKSDRYTPPQQPERVAINQAHWTALQTYVAKTFVPQSNASRLAGAGAGLTDND